MRSIVLCLALIAFPVASEEPAVTLALIPPGAIVLTSEEQTNVLQYVAQIQHVAEAQQREIRRLRVAKGCL